MSTKAKTKKEKAAPNPIEYRAITGGKNPTIGLFVSGQFKETVADFQREARDITATSLAQELNRAFQFGARLMVSAQEQEATTAATPAAEQEPQ